MYNIFNNSNSLLIINALIIIKVEINDRIINYG